MTISINTCIRALNSAAMNRKAAFQIELAVGLAVFLTMGSTDKPARDMLVDAYSSAGYDCVRANGADYKTVNRRVNATARLFDKLPAAVWAGRHREDRLLQALMLGLAPYEFFTARDVERFCAPERVLPSRPPLAVKPAPGAIEAPPTTGQQVIRDMFRRASDRVPEGSAVVDVEHVHVVVPPEASAAELMELARKLLEVAAQREQLLTA